MIPFHRFLIGTAICFCLGLAAWALAGWRGGGGTGGLVLGIAFACAGGLLAYYLKHLNRFLGR